MITRPCSAGPSPLRAALIFLASSQKQFNVCLARRHLQPTHTHLGAAPAEPAIALVARNPELISLVLMAAKRAGIALSVLPLPTIVIIVLVLDKRQVW